jgi:hypothetical protein
MVDKIAVLKVRMQVRYMAWLNACSVVPQWAARQTSMKATW